MKKIFIILICLLIASPAFAFNKYMIKLSKSFKKYENELVKIQSYRAFDFYAIQEGWHKESPSEFDALIIYPKGEGPFPLVMISHSSWGPEEYASKWMLFHKQQTKKLLKMGFATMFIGFVIMSIIGIHFVEVDYPNNYKDKEGFENVVITKEGYIPAIIFAIINAIIMYGLSDKIYM